MIMMPQLYQHELLFKSHDAMGHQGIAKVLSRIPGQVFAEPSGTTLVSVYHANKYAKNLVMWDSI